MLKHYLKTALRNLLRSKLFTTINVIGLSVGIAVFLALTGNVSWQFSYDKFYKGGDRIYRINYFEYQQQQPVLASARTHDRTATLVQSYTPQVAAVARIYNEKAYVFTEDVRLVDQDMLFADSTFFDVFPVKVLQGDARTALAPPKSVMISASQAKVYFGDADPMGKTLYFNERLPFIVTGVFEDIPSNSSIDFDFLLSWSTMPFYGWISRDGDFRAPWTFTYVRLKENAGDLAPINAGLTRMANEHITTLEKRRHTARYELQPYESLHTSPALSGEIKPTTSRILLYALLSLAIFILIAAWINYINLSLARSLERADEIGVRKAFGASRWSINGQFMLEALLLATVTFVTGAVLYGLFTGPLALEVFNNVPLLTRTPLQWVGYFVVFAAATTLIAYYPAQIMSRLKPVLILKNRMGSGKGGAALLHRILMTFQLFLAVGILGITLIARQQVDFMRNFDAGLNTRQSIALRAPASTNSDSLRQSRYRAFRNEVLRTAAFESGTASMNIPGQEIRFHDEDVHAVGSSNEKKQSFWIMWVDEGYVPTFGLTVTAGRNFNAQEAIPSCLVNESAARALGYANPADAVNTDLITSGDSKLTIVGILRDYHHESVRKAIDPILYVMRHPHEYGYYSFRANSREGTFLEALEEIWKKHYPNDTYTYYFMDSFFEDQYQSDALFSALLQLFSVIAIFVASLGLFGMATLSMVKRTKEIAVRKVLGASAGNILVMISRSYLLMILIGCLFAFPLTYYLTTRWLESFANKIAVQWWMILVPGLMVLLTTLLTIGGLSLRAAMANPARSLKEQ